MSREAEGRQMYEKGRKRNYRIQRMLLHNIHISTMSDSIYQNEKELLLIKMIVNIMALK